MSARVVLLILAIPGALENAPGQFTWKTSRHLPLRARRFSDETFWRLRGGKEENEDNVPEFRSMAAKDPSLLLTDRNLQKKELRKVLKEDPNLYDYDGYLTQRDRDTEAQLTPEQLIQRRLKKEAEEERKRRGGLPQPKYIETAKLYAEQRKLEYFIRQSYADAPADRIGAPKRYYGKNYRAHLSKMEEKRKELTKNHVPDREERAMYSLSAGPLSRLARLHAGATDRLTQDLEQKLKPRNFEPSGWGQISKDMAETRAMQGGIDTSVNKDPYDDIATTKSGGETPSDNDVILKDHPKLKRWVNWRPDHPEYLKQIDPNGPRTLDEMEQMYDKSHLALEAKADAKKIKRELKHDAEKAEQAAEEQAKQEEKALLSKLRKLKHGDNSTLIRAQLDEVHRRARPILTTEMKEALRKGSGYVQASERKERLLEKRKKKRKSVQEEVEERLEAERQALKERREFKAKRKRALERQQGSG